MARPTFDWLDRNIWSAAMQIARSTTGKVHEIA
jgi:hypothetical protein